MNVKTTDPIVLNHYGVWVISTDPITGVIHNTNQAEFLLDEIQYNEACNLDFERHVNECEDCKHDLLCEVMENWEYSDNTILIGDWILDTKTNLWESDHTGSSKYAAIVGEIYTQIVWSKYASKSQLCSPCYPGQGDLSNKGDFLTYDLPTDIYGDWLEHEIIELKEIK